MNTSRNPYTTPIASLFLLIIMATHVFAHCDSMDGPVVEDAKRAFEANDITPILKWIDPEDQDEVARVFQMTMDIRSKSEEVRKVADTYFFETLVRVHRKSEGEGFTGLKPAGSTEPPIAAADRALADGDVDELADKISADVRAGIVARFRDAHGKKQHADETVEKGREFVQAYVQYTHFLVAVHRLASHGADHTHQDAHPK